MAWPEAKAYYEAVQSPRVAFRDAELHGGVLASNALGLPLIHTGSFAAVFQMRRPAGPPESTPLSDQDRKTRTDNDLWRLRFGR